MILLTALAPLLLVLFFLVILRLQTSLSMMLAYLLSCTLALWYWQMPLLQLAASALDGVIIALTVLSIMAGALLLLAFVRQTGRLEQLRQSFARLSPDPRLQLLWLGWFGVAFLEGIAGFGTPAAIIAPLLLTLGFSAPAAVVLSLVADSAPVSFGALGTPLLIGIAQGAGISEPTALLAIAKQLLHIDLLAAPLLPVLMLLMYCRLFNRTLPLRPALPHALLAGVAYSGSALLWLTVLGPEFVTVLAAVSGFSISYVFNRWRPLAFQPQPVATLAATGTSATAASPGATATPLTSASVTAKPLTATSSTPRLSASTEAGFPSLWQALLPYLLLIGLLLLSRLPGLPLQAYLQSYQWRFPQLLGTDISSTVTPLYLPSVFFLLVILLLLPLASKRRQLLQACWYDCWPKLRGAALTLLFALPLVRLFVHSGVNDAYLPAMPVYLAELAGFYLSEHWLAFSALLGALGSFIAGSATFSNLLFADMQQQVAVQAGLPAHLVLALQMLGANAGNMICLLNLVAAASVVGLQGQERQLLKLTIWPMLGYVSLATLLAALLTTVMSTL